MKNDKIPLQYVQWYTPPKRNQRASEGTIHLSYVISLVVMEADAAQHFGHMPEIHPTNATSR